MKSLDIWKGYDDDDQTKLQSVENKNECQSTFVYVGKKACPWLTSEIWNKVWEQVY